MEELPKKMSGLGGPFAVEEWAAEMAAAVAGIDASGRKLVATHRRGSERAEEVCRNWHLEERQAEQQSALSVLFTAARAILDGLNTAIETGDERDLAAAAETIDNHLPSIEEAFLTVRHCAQDLLQWAQRHGDPNRREVTDEYRARHGRLTSYAPVFKPRLEAFQMALVDHAARPEAGKATGALLSAITRYNAVLDSARRFVAVVVDPPLELVFAETDRFLEDVDRIPVEMRAGVASELNDCCRHLMYDPVVFADRVRPVELKQPEGVESSLVAFESRGIHVLLTVEEDPIFGQLTVHLLRAVMKDEFDSALAGVAEALAEEWR